MRQRQTRRHRARQPPPLAGQHELAGGQAPIASGDGHRAQVGGCRRREDRTGRLDQPLGVSLVLCRLPLLADPPLDGHLPPEGGEGGLLPEKAPPRRTRVPEHQVVHGAAAGELGGRQRGAEPEPHDADPVGTQGADEVDGEADVPEPLRHEARVGPGAHRVPRRGVVQPKCGPARTDQEVGQGAQRARSSTPPRDPCWGTRPRHPSRARRRARRARQTAAGRVARPTAERTPPRRPGGRSPSNRAVRDGDERVSLRPCRRVTPDRPCRPRGPRHRDRH